MGRWWGDGGEMGRWGDGGEVGRWGDGGNRRDSEK